MPYKNINKNELKTNIKCAPIKCIEVKDRTLQNLDYSGVIIDMTSLTRNTKAEENKQTYMK